MLNRKKIQRIKESKTKEELRGFKICGACYKPFMRTWGTMYKLSYQGHIYTFCCYTCYRNAQKFIEEERKRNGYET